MSFNKIIIVGNLGRDPELRYTPQGTPVASFSMATNSRRKDKSGEAVEQATWFRVTVFGKQAETVSKYLTKGRKAYVEGRLALETYTDKDGKERTSLEVTADAVQFIDSAPAGEQAAAAGAGAPSTAASPVVTGAPKADDEIPF
jgi:single-strand DNA-binding protein